MVMDTLVQVGESKANVASALHCVTQCNTVHRNESNYLLNNFISDVRILWNTLISNFFLKGGVRTINRIVRFIITQLIQTHYIHY